MAEYKKDQSMFHGAFKRIRKAETVLGDKKESVTRSYLVQWKYRWRAEAEWLPESALNCPYLLQFVRVFPEQN